MKKISSLTFFVLIFFGIGSSIVNAQQEHVVSGRVISDADGKPLDGVVVNIDQTTLSTLTDSLGNYSLRLPPGEHVLLFRLVGYQNQREEIRGRPIVNISLLPVVGGLDEVIVTGVAVGTSRAKVPFSVSKIDEKQINTVPALDLSQTLRGKVAGINIYQTEGDNAASVFLRGAKSLFGNVSPLIVVDGYVTSLSLGDINPLDVESIEVVKGAAGAALYGSRAEGGVIQVITKKGKAAKNRLAITVDNEVGTNSIQRIPKLATLHPYQTDDDDEYGFAYSGGARVLNYADNGFSYILSPYKKYYDNVHALLDGRPYYTNYISLSTAGEKYNAYISFQNQDNSGVIKTIKSNVRRTAKLNLDLRPTPQWQISTNLSYYYNSKPSAILSRDGQGTAFASILQFEPFLDLTEKDSTGEYVTVPSGIDIQGGNINFNPLYQYGAIRYKNYSSEIIGAGRVTYKILPNLTAEAYGSYDQSFSTNSTVYPIGYKTATESETLNNGNIYLYSGKSTYINGQAQINYNTKWNDFDFAATLKETYELSYDQGFSASGYNISTPIYTLDNSQASGRGVSGSDEKANKTVNYGYYLNIKTSYKDKFFIDALARIDRSSRYGVNQESAFFPRVSGAYRVTKDLDLGPVNELKVRASWGLAGTLPGFGYKDSRATVSNSGISITQNSNTDLKRSYTNELELGFDASIFKRIDVTFNYANANSKGDFVQPPSFIPLEGSASAYKNFGRVNSKSIELEVRGNTYRSRNFDWDLGLTFARTRSKIKELGTGLAPWASGLYWKDEGVSPWAFYGNKVLTSLSELTVEDGLVTNAASGTHPLSDFKVNSLGHVILAADEGTANEKPLLLQEGGSSKSVVIGDGQPDFTTGLNSTLTFFKRLSLYFTFDWKQGGQKYDQTIQYLTFSDRSYLWQEYAQRGLPEAYIQALYNGNTYTSFWVEKNSYLSLREVSVSYILPFSKKSPDKNVRIAFTGRNLFTWTGFNGTNPEGYSEYFPYPTYRTYTAKLTLNF
ncbi:MAG: SusC/RagA family TonB-linked outer membrane protein [Chitinophagaceae bacterium]